MRGLAVIVTVLATTAGCDLVFAPGTGPRSNGDGRIDDGPLGADARADADPDHPDADVSVPDAPPPPPDSSTCSAVFTCYAPDFSPGDPPPPGVAGCELDDDDACPGFPGLVEIDICSCTAGGPELYVEPAGTIGVVVFVGDPPLSNWSVLSSTDGSCRGGSANCSHDGPCYPGSAQWVWSGVPTTLGTNTFAIYDDSGAGCIDQPVYTFTVNL